MPWAVHAAVWLFLNSRARNKVRAESPTSHTMSSPLHLLQNVNGRISHIYNYHFEMLS